MTVHYLFLHYEVENEWRWKPYLFLSFQPHRDFTYLYEDISERIKINILVLEGNAF